jgi:hypothetical protein
MPEVRAGHRRSASTHVRSFRAGNGRVRHDPEDTALCVSAHPMSLLGIN